MNCLIKNIRFKSWIILFLASGLLLVSESDVDARYIKKLAVEPFSDPVNWEKPFKPGTVFSLIIENGLADSGQFQMMKLQSSITKFIKEESREVSKMEKVENIGEKVGKDNILDITSSLQSPLSQYQIRGKILKFNPDTDPLKKGHTKKEAKIHRERAAVTAIIELVNLHTGRSLAKKKFTTVSSDGRTAFNLNWTKLDYKSDEFKSPSIGKTLWKLKGLVEAFIIKILNEVPMEGDLIWVDHNNKSALINLGKINGVMVQDVFTVFSVKAGFNDPVDKVDLGDMYTRKGIIKISEVQGRFSRAQILVGLDFVPGDLVVPKIRGSQESMSEGQSLQQNYIIWGPYKGLPSLSY